MYEIINATEYGLETDKPYLIVKSEPAFRSGRSLVFTVHSEKDALEILAALLGDPDA